MIRFVVDSSADYEKNELKDKGLYLVPLNTMLGGKNYRGGCDLESDQFYELMEKTGEFPTTSQPSPQDFLDIFEDAKKSGDEVICILLSSALSGTYQSAALAKDMAGYEPVYIIDSRTATGMIRLITDYAMKLAGEGKTAAQIVEKAEAFKSRAKVVAALDTLEYLHRGGRISKTAAAIGEMANLKPLITVTEEGTVGIVGKALGKNKAISLVLKNLHGYQLDPAFPLYSIYTYGTDNCTKLEEKLLAEGFRPEGRLQVGSVIGSHVGPGAFGVIFVTK